MKPTESDGSIVQYEPEIGLLLNIDKDHQEIEELIELFTIFKNNTISLYIVNQSNKLAKTLSANPENDFGFENENAGFNAKKFCTKRFSFEF